MIIKSIRQAKNLTAKKVFLRVDFNVPLAGDQIKDDFKIVASLPTIRFLLRHHCSLIIATHLTKTASAESTISTKPIAKRLGELLDKKIKFIDSSSGPEISKIAAKLKPCEILLLDNLRLDSREEKNNSQFARELASLADIYVNEAFAVSHRQHASLSAIKKYLPVFAGLLLAKEIVNLNKVLKPVEPLVAIIGGVKIETKAALIKKLLKKSDRLLIGGALANNFIAAHGFAVGRSVIDQASLKIAAKLKSNKKIILPVDAVVSDRTSGGPVAVKTINRIDKNEMILDIGPKTIKLYASFIKKANTLIWNGPMGYFENEHFKHGTLAIARLVASRSTGKAFGVVGGGETIAALKMTKMEHYVDWVSTGGGAMLAYLSGAKLPGLRGIIK